MPDLRAVPSAEAPLVAEAARLTPDSSTEDVEVQLAALALADLGPLRENVVLAVIRNATKRSIGDLRRTVQEFRQRLSRVDMKPATWRDGLRRNRYAEPQATAANVLIALQHAPEWQGVLAWNDFDSRPWLRQRPAWANSESGERQLTDADEARILVWMQDHGIQCKLTDVRTALAIETKLHAWHPVRDWLASLEWDGEFRLHEWLTRGLGVAPIAGYTDQVGTKWLVSAVARVMRPGCQVKYVLTLEGRQDIGKSKALAILARPWFTDDMETIGSKDSKLSLSGILIIELADLSAMRRAHLDATKAFISRQVDRYRPPYGHNLVEVPRQCIFAATTNESEWLEDDTDNVRFWPVKCGATDLGWVEAHRDQLWAEAYVRYVADEPWWFEEAVEPVREQQDKRLAYDEFEQRIRDWLTDHAPDRVTVTELLTRCLSIEDARDHTKSLQSRVGRLMIHRIGWAMRRSAGKRWYERR